MRHYGAGWKKLSKVEAVKELFEVQMYQERANGLAILCIEKILLDEIDINTIINGLASRYVKINF